MGYCGVERMQRHQFMYSIGMHQRSLAAASLIYSGLLEKYPNLKVCFSHGGGSFPYVLARIDESMGDHGQYRTTEENQVFMPKSFILIRLFMIRKIFNL